MIGNYNLRSEGLNICVSQPYHFNENYVSPPKGASSTKIPEIDMDIGNLGMQLLLNVF